MQEAISKIDATLLAAGQSSRMSPQDKLLISVYGQPMIVHVSSILKRCDLRNVHVVLPNEGFDGRASALCDLNLKTVKCSISNEGIGASIAFSVEQLDPNCEGLLIVLADMPDICERDLQNMLAISRPDRIVALSKNGQRGNPVLFGRDFFPQLANLSGDIGARSVIKKHREALHLVECLHSSSLIDIDTPEDWADWRQRNSDPFSD